MGRPRLFARKSIVGSSASSCLSFSSLNQQGTAEISKKKEAPKEIIIIDDDDDDTTTTTTTTQPPVPIKLQKLTVRKTAGGLQEPPPATSGLGNQTLATTMAYRHHVMMRERLQQQKQKNGSHDACHVKKKKVVTPSPLQKKTVNHNYKMRKRSHQINYASSLQSSSSEEDNDDENYRDDNGNSNGDGSDTDDDYYYHESHVDNHNFHLRHRPRRNEKRLCRYRPTTDLKVLFKQEEEDDNHGGGNGNCSYTPHQIQKRPKSDQQHRSNNKKSKDDAVNIDTSKLKDPPPLSHCCFKCGLWFETKLELENHEKDSYAV